MLTISISPEAAAEISALCERAPGVETGGAMFGVQRAGVLEIVHVCGPGPLARATPRTLEWDASYVTGYIEAVHQVEAGPVAFVGRWHRHTTLLALASEPDRTGAHKTRDELRLPSIADVIVATGQGHTPRAWCGYICTDAGYHRTELEVGA